MDREHKRKTTGIHHSIQVLKQLFDMDAILHGDPKRNTSFTDLVAHLHDDFSKWLGESLYKDGLVGVPPSRFSETNSNGLWEYSPFLCGAGLSEALELSYGAAMLIWDTVPEPMCIIHIHNMLVKKGLLKRSVGIRHSLTEIFKECIFSGEVPSSHFSAAFEHQVGGLTSRREGFGNRARRLHVASDATNLIDNLDTSGNHFFKLKSILQIYKAKNIEVKPSGRNDIISRNFIT